MNCDGFCFDDYDPEEDDFEIQRLQDIISICEFLIKHKRNNKLRTELDELLDAEKDNKKKKVLILSIGIDYHKSLYGYCQIIVLIDIIGGQLHNSLIYFF